LRVPKWCPSCAPFAQFLRFGLLLFDDYRLFQGTMLGTSLLGNTHPLR